jgi:hypothetical protein
MYPWADSVVSQEPVIYVVDGEGPRAGQTEPVLSETDIAADFRGRLGQMLHPICKLMDEAAKHDLELRFMLQKGPSGKHIIPPIDVVKHL